jgi:hypothetical protein
MYAYMVTVTTSNAHKRSRTQPGAFHLVQLLWIGCLSKTVPWMLRCLQACKNKDCVLSLQVHGGPIDDVSPIIHVQLEQPLETIWQGKALLQRVVDDAFQNEGVLFTVHRLSDLDKAYSKTPASICIAITAQHSQADMQKAADALQKACSRCLAAN